MSNFLVNTETLAESHLNLKKDKLDKEKRFKSEIDRYKKDITIYD